MIRSGKVYVADRVADKPGLRLPDDSIVRIKTPLPYVSRGGLKLEKALQAFHLDPHDMICADIGASTGGFTDCLLQHGAARVYAIDVAYGMLAWKLRTDPRVTVLERLNVRHLTTENIDIPIDLAVFDTSFISLTKVIPPVLPFFEGIVRIIALIKPQFEAPREQVSPGGIVTARQFREEAVSRIEQFGISSGLTPVGVIDSPIRGAKGNQEYLVYFLKD